MILHRKEGLELDRADAAREETIPMHVRLTMRFHIDGRFKVLIAKLTDIALALEVIRDDRFKAGCLLVHYVTLFTKKLLIIQND